MNSKAHGLYKITNFITFIDILHYISLTLKENNIYLKFLWIRSTNMLENDYFSRIFEVNFFLFFFKARHRASEY